MGSYNFTIALFAAIIVIIGVSVWLQTFLSKRKNKSGLVLPIIFFVFSLLNVLSIENTTNLKHNIILYISTLIISNIPTAVLMMIYFSFKNKIKKNAQIEKMNIQDLQ